MTIDALLAALRWPGCLLLGLAASGAALATADGPDHYRLRGGPVVMRAAPRADAPTVARLPADAGCLRNLGCQGGPSFAAFAAREAAGLPPQDVPPRWCRVTYAGRSGWVEGRRLAEAGCAVEAPQVIRGHIRGDASVDYPVHAQAGQTLDVNLAARHGQLYFNVLPPGSEEAMFIGSQAGGHFSRRLPADGTYTLRVYLMRAAARRNEAADYSLRTALGGTPLVARAAAVDALVPGTPYHATATLRCARGGSDDWQGCDAGVIRRGIDGTATVDVRWPATGEYRALRRVLFEHGRPVASDATGELEATRDGDLTRLRIGGDERIEVPDALLTGG